MGFRFQRVVSNYPGYLKQFYARRPGLAERPYAEQHAAHIYNAIERSDFFSVALQKYGYETDEIIADAEPMQKQWAREHDISCGENTWMADIVLAQIQAFRPEVLFLSSWRPDFGAAFVQHCRETVPSIRLVLGWVGEAHPGAGHFRAHDLVLSCAPETVAYLHSEGIPAYHLHHAFEPAILDRIAAFSADDSVDKPIDVGFVGHVFFGEKYHNNRVRILYDFARHVDLEIYGEMPKIVYQKHGIQRYVRQGYYAIIKQLERIGLARFARHLPHYDVWQEVKDRLPYEPLYAFLLPHVHPPIYGLAMYQTVSTFKICLNTHGPSAYASNMRLYEATGVGTCLLTDWKSNLPELFEPDTEIVTYRNANEAVEKARYLLEHDQERQAIAQAGQRRTLRDHTTAQRVATLHSIILDYMRHQ